MLTSAASCLLEDMIADLFLPSSPAQSIPQEAGRALPPLLAWLAVLQGLGVFRIIRVTPPLGMGRGVLTIPSSSLPERDRAVQCVPGWCRLHPALRELGRLARSCLAQNCLAQQCHVVSCPCSSSMAGCGSVCPLSSSCFARGWNAGHNPPLPFSFPLTEL